MYDCCPSVQVGTKLRLMYLHWQSGSPHISWRCCPLFQLVILAPFPVSCMDARTLCMLPMGVCNRAGESSSGSPLFYINSWAMIWPVVYQSVGSWELNNKKHHFLCQFPCGVPKHAVTYWQRLAKHSYIRAHTGTYLHIREVHIRAHTYMRAYTCIYMHIHAYTCIYCVLFIARMCTYMKYVYARMLYVYCAVYARICTYCTYMHVVFVRNLLVTLICI